MAHVQLTTEVSAPIEQVFDLARDIDFHTRSLADTGERAVAGRTSGLIGSAETVTWQARYLGRTWSLTGRITVFEPPARFVDEQVSGPFAWFRHEHRFEPIPGGTRMTDDWRHAAPFGVIGRLVDALLLERLMRRVLETRAAALAQEAVQRAEATTSAGGDDFQDVG